MAFVVNVVHNFIHDVILGSFKGIYDLFQAIMNNTKSQFSVINDFMKDIVNDKKGHDNVNDKQFCL